MLPARLGILLAGLALLGGPPTPASAGSDAAEALTLPVVFPEHPIESKTKDAYLCTAVRLPDRPLKLVGVEPTSDMHVVHHMLLFGCQLPAREVEVWPCKMEPACGTSSESVLYGWGKNAPPMAMPQGAGFSVGPGTGIRTLVLQMHYLNGRPANDTSGLVLHLSSTPVAYSAGMAAFATSFRIPPLTKSTLINNTCCYSGWEPLHGFAARVHTHAMGREVHLDRDLPDNATQQHVVALDPQKPQGFYPVKPEAMFLPGDRLGMACNFESTNVEREVVAGHTASDEMCNLYLMLYSQLPFFWWCLDSHAVSELHGPGGLPANGHLAPEMVIWQPPSKVKRAGAAAKPFPIGQVSGVASRGDGTVWAFHRGARAWKADGSVADPASGTASGAMEAVTAALEGPTVLQLDEDSGQVMQAWGSNRFVMPHMITPDWEGNLWVTDVALHQAIKFSPAGEELQALGKKGQKGDGPEAFCKPTQVAVGRDGAIYVSDGYCNSRVAEFTANGTWVRDYSLPFGEEPMLVPHSVVIHECRRLLLVAERERGNVHAFELGTGHYKGKWSLFNEFGLPYALAMGPYGSIMALVFNPNATPAQSWIVALDEHPGVVVGSWDLKGLEYPHDLALVPAPLAVTGAGERLLAVLVSETKDQGQNMHKFVFTHSDTPLGGSATPAADEQLTAAELEEAASLAAAKASAAAHFGGSTHATAPSAAGQQPGAEEGEGEEEPAAAIGHSLVKPVDEDKGDASGSGQQTVQQPVQQKAASAAAEDDLEEGEGEPPQAQATQPRKAGEETPRTGHTMVQPVAGDAEEEQEEKTGQQQQQHEEEQQAQQQEAQQQEQQEGSAAAGGGSGVKAQEQQEVAVITRSEEAAEAAGVQEGGWEALTSSGYKQAMSRSAAATLPAVLGVVFVAVALVAWSRLQHWRGHSGAGYQAAGRGLVGHGGAGDPQFSSQGHLGNTLGQRAAAPPHEHV